LTLKSPSLNCTSFSVGASSLPTFRRPLSTAPAEWIDRLSAVLVDNACKYAGEGGSVHIEVGRIGPRVIFAVGDTGPGIPPAERERLFDRFRRGTNQAGRHG